MPSKSFTTEGHQLVIEGLSNSDPYFALIEDGFEASFARFCQAYLHPDSRCWDIGANIGITSVLLSKICFSGNVMAVEAGQRVFELLRRNLNDNGAANVTPVNAAVGGTDRQVHFTENSAYGAVSNTGSPIEMLSAPTLFVRSGMDRLDFVKIDIEGMEPAFVETAMPLFEKHRPVIHIEFNSWCLIYNSRINPLEFAERLFSAFPNVYLFGGSRNVVQITDAGPAAFMHDHITQRGGLDDLILSYSPLSTLGSFAKS